MHLRRRGVVRLALVTISTAGLALASAPPALGHTVQHAGKYTLEIGWRAEPTYVGQPNAVSVTITESGKPVTDLPADALSAVVTTGGQSSPSLSFEPGFDPEEMEGPLGEYDAAIVPTAPGDYTFHITGKIHDQAVDITVTSAPDTFDAVKGFDELEFPIKQPGLGDVATRLDRIDARIAALQSMAPDGSPDGAVNAANAAQAAASDALAAANRALLVGVIVGGLGLAVAVVAVYLARRSPRGNRPT